jgi:hypothetical protein
MFSSHGAWEEEKFPNGPFCQGVVPLLLDPHVLSVDAWNFQLPRFPNRLGREFFESHWLSCSLLRASANPSEQKVPALQGIYHQMTIDGKCPEGSTESTPMLEFCLEGSIKQGFV